MTKINPVTSYTADVKYLTYNLRCQNFSVSAAPMESYTELYAQWLEMEIPLYRATLYIGETTDNKDFPKPVRIIEHARAPISFTCGVTSLTMFKHRGQPI